MNERRPLTLRTQSRFLNLFQRDHAGSAVLRRESKAIMYYRRQFVSMQEKGREKLIFDNSLSSAYVPESSLSPIEESRWRPFVECL